MPAKKLRGRIQDAVWQRLRELSLAPMSEALQGAHKKAEKAVSFTYWLADHCADFSAVCVFLDELKSDLIGVLFAQGPAIRAAYHAELRAMVYGAITASRAGK